MQYHPKNEIDNSPMRLVQYVTIIVCFLMNILDGMDVIIISYTAPAIAKDWNISPANLGIVFSSGLVGMTVGAMFFAPYADNVGRKSLMLISAVIMSSCIYLTKFADNINVLMIFRFLSGIGLGAMLACTAALTAEYTPNKSKDFWVSIVIMGTPVGAVISGLASATVISMGGWQHAFEWAGMITFLAVPILYFFLSESFDFYLKAQPKNALQKANAILKKLHMPLMEILPQKSEEQHLEVSVKTLLGSEYRRATLQLWVSLFLAFSTLYFMINWIPKLAANAGVSIQSAIYAGTIFNLGAIIGIATQGYLSSRFGLKKTIGVILIFTSLIMLCFGFFMGSDIVLFIFFLLGFGIQGGFVGLYALAARMYPTRIRSTGVGWAIGSGRLGGIIGPIIGGLLVGMGLNMTQNFWVFAIPTLLSGLMTLKISS
ncbi:MAG: MFS transporter [Chitinophagaceae bacterium]